MTVIERRYFSGLIEIQIDHTRSSSGHNELDSHDEYESSFETIEKVNEFIEDIDEEFTRLPDIN